MAQHPNDDICIECGVVIPGARQRHLVFGLLVTEERIQRCAVCWYWVQWRSLTCRPRPYKLPAQRPTRENMPHPDYLAKCDRELERWVAEGLPEGPK